MNQTTTQPSPAAPLRRPLECIFEPRSVAVIGATEAAGSVGRTVLANLLKGSFSGAVYPVNPKRESVLGVRCWQKIAAVPEKVDLAVIVTPAIAVPKVIEECGAAGVRGAIVISAGFKEMGPEGALLERKVLKQARLSGVRIVGPNCLGVMNPAVGLNATFAAGMAKPGSVAFLSQSGALGTAVLDWSLREGVGFSGFVSTGSMIDVGWGDLIDYFGEDPATKSILIYMESIGDVQSFMSSAREVALTKPIIVIKAGKTAAAAKAAASHTGALTGSDDVLDAAFRRAGVLRVERISDLFYMAEVLSRSPRLAGNRLAIVTNAGGPAVLATDALVGGGGELSTMSAATMAALNQILPPHWSHNNPIDVLGDANPDRYAQALEIVAKDNGSDGLLVILTPQDMTDPTAIAERLRDSAATVGKPVLASWMGAGSVAAGREILNKAGIPVFDFPDSAARAFNYMWRYAANLKMLYETPAADESGEDPSVAKAAAADIIDAVGISGRTILTEDESKNLLAAYGIPVVQARRADEAEHAVRIAEQIGYPVVLKIFSRTITHKTDVGGVELNLGDADAVRRAYAAIKENVGRTVGDHHFEGVTVQQMIRREGYELILGSSTDAQFGPVLMFGLGGQLVEVLKDRALALPPLNRVLARRMIEQTRIYAALKGVRGREAVELDELEKIIVRFSQLVVDHPWIKEIEINPILASPRGLLALDARAVLHDQGAHVRLPKPAIRPYPSQYVSDCSLRDGTKVKIRPIRPEDEPLMVRFHQNLSDESVRFRYFHAISLNQRAAHERLIGVCMSDYDRQIALVAERIGVDGAREIIGVGRLAKIHGTRNAEFAIIVHDQWQHQGLGTLLLESLVRIAKAEKLACVAGDVMRQNTAMLHVCERVGFALARSDEDEMIVRAEIRIKREK